jgi:hypothetical protein
MRESVITGIRNAAELYRVSPGLKKADDLLDVRKQRSIGFEQHRPSHRERFALHDDMLANRLRVAQRPIERATFGIDRN